MLAQRDAAVDGGASAQNCEEAVRRWWWSCRVKIAADDFRWTSPPLSFNHDNYGEHVWEISAIPYTPQVSSVVTKMVTAKESIIRFEGRRGTSDLAVTDDMKSAIVLMTKEIAAIKR